MNKLQAAMKDRSAASWKERRQYYKVGSWRKGCAFCGMVVLDDDDREKFVTGMNVFRSYRPWQIGWTFKCWDCGATDLICWADDQFGLVSEQLGKEPILGVRDVVASKKYALRKKAMALNPGEVKPKNAASPAVDPTKLDKIKELELQILRLKQILESVKR